MNIVDLDLEDSETECRPILFDAKGSQKVEAKDRQVSIWKEWTKMADHYQEDDWRKNCSAWKLVDRYTGHKSAQSFKAHEKDAEMFELNPISQKAQVKTEIF